MTETAPAIQVAGLSKAFGRQAVLDGISFQVAAGETVALTGHNGCGKTTLLRCLAAVVRPTAGEVRWFGQPAMGRRAARPTIALLTHDCRLYPQLTVRENLVFAARMYGLEDVSRRADESLDELGLHRHGHRVPRELSRGMRQRVAIARELMHRPRLLFLDEPFAGLDAEAAAWLGRRLHDLRAEGRTICIALHDADLIGRLADRVLELRRGRIFRCGSDASLIADNSSTTARAA